MENFMDTFTVLNILLLLMEVKDELKYRDMDQISTGLV
jgi:hypothetical protein